MASEQATPSGESSQDEASSSHEATLSTDNMIVTGTVTSIDAGEGYQIEIRPDEAAQRMLTSGETFAIAMLDENGRQVIQQLKANAQGHLEVIDTKPVKAGDIPLVVNENNNAEGVQKTVPDELRFVCGVCEEVFETQKDREAHLWVHSDKKVLKCADCDKYFTTERGLELHRKTHSDERPFQCEYCPKSFKQKGGLINHTRHHTGQRPFVCDICHTGFIDNGSLKKHKRVHTGERPYGCDLCGKCFSSSGLMRSHRRIHTGERPYKCRICPKTFTEAGSRNKHEKIHAGEKPHRCPVCDKAFLQSSHVVRHLRIHTGEKPFVCRSCPKSYGHSESLLKHNRQHHSIDAKHVQDVMKPTVGSVHPQIVDATQYEVLHVSEVLKDQANQGGIVIVGEEGEENLVVVQESGE